MKRCYVFLLLIVFLAGLAGCSRRDDLLEIAASLSNYHITIDLDADSKFAECKQSIEYVNNSNNILREVKFHLYPQFFEEGATHCVISNTKLNNAYPNGMSYAEFEVTRVTVDGIDGDILYEGEHDGILRVLLSQSLLPDNSVEIGIDYNFRLPNCQHRFGYGDDTINLGNFYPIACVYENDGFSTNPYNANGDPFYSEVSNYSIDLTVDSNYTVASTGCQSIVSKGDGKTKYKIEENVVRDFALVLSDQFDIRSTTCDNITINYYFYSDNDPDRALQAGVDALKTFSMFGDYPYTHFSIVQADFVHGGMEYPGLVYVSDNIQDRDDYMNVIIHETAHQWWYAMVGNDEYNEPWLDEALTEYSTILFYDMNDGYSLNHADMINASKENYTLFVTVYKDVLGDLDTSMRAVYEYDTEPEYVYCTYVKGVLMLDSLYSLVGKKDFISSLNLYFDLYKYKNAKSLNFIECFEMECGVDLQSFFDSWQNGKVVVR